MRVSTMRALMTSILAALLLPVASGAQTAPGDRYLCYNAGLLKGQPKFSSVQKALEDQFWTSVANVNGFASLCNPALPAQHPSVHQVGYRTALAKEKPAQKFVKSTHTAFDQFGSHPLMVVRPLEVRAPSAKVVGSGGTPTVSTTGVDHFQCYRTTLPKHTPKLAPIAVSITDEFGSLDLTLTRITKLCAPVNKAGEDPTAPQHAGHLVCYHAKLAKGVKFPATTVSVNNTNFGPAVLVARSVGELCVPAFKDVVPSPTPTPKPTATPTPTHTPTRTPMHTPTPTPTPINIGPSPSPIFCDTQIACPVGESCDFSRHVCRFTCVSVLCDAQQQICCNGGGGICCDFSTQICNDQQTACTTPNCQVGETYVPNKGVCCQDISVCPNKFTGADCCTTDEKCQLDESGDGACVPLTTVNMCDTQTPCPSGQFCDFNKTPHICEFSCGSVSCDANTQICCLGGGGICCNSSTEICNDQQTACTTPTCQVGETYVPKDGVCCQNTSVCPNQFTGTDCCTTGEQCRLDGSGNGACVRSS